MLLGVCCSSNDLLAECTKLGSTRQRRSTCPCFCDLCARALAEFFFPSLFFSPLEISALIAPFKDCTAQLCCLINYTVFTFLHLISQHFMLTEDVCKTLYVVFLLTDVQQNFSSFVAREKFLHFLIIHTAAADSMNLANFSHKHSSVSHNHNTITYGCCNFFTSNHRIKILGASIFSCSTEKLAVKI